MTRSVNRKPSFVTTKVTGEVVLETPCGGTRTLDDLHAWVDAIDELGVAGGAHVGVHHRYASDPSPSKLIATAVIEERPQANLLQLPSSRSPRD